MGKRFVKTKTLASIGIWMICLAGYPFCMRYAFDYPFMIPLLAGLILLFLMLIIKNSYYGTINVNKTFIRLFIIILSFWLFQMTFRAEAAYISNVFQVLCILTIYLAIMNFVTADSMIKQYVFFMIINCIGGTIITVLLFIHDFPPLFQYLHHNGLSMASFYYLTFTNVAYDFGGLTIIRYSGLFDEPGAVSFYCMFALLLNKLYIKSKKNELFLLFLPMFTFSLAHFITVVVYSILFYMKRMSSLLFIVIFLTSTYCLLEYAKDTEYSHIYELTIGRLQIDSSGKIKGDNRTELNENSFVFFREEPLIGKGKTFFEDKTHPIGGIFYYGALYGFIGYIFIYIILYHAIFVCLFQSKGIAVWMDGLKCCLVILVNLFQRPDMTNIFQMFSLTLFALCIYQLVSSGKTPRVIFAHEKTKTTIVHNNNSVL